MVIGPRHWLMNDFALKLSGRQLILLWFVLLEGLLKGMCLIRSLEREFIEMQGLIFVTWEKSLAERFGTSLLNTYRNKIGETPAHSPLASRVYDDAVLLTGV